MKGMLCFMRKNPRRIILFSLWGILGILLILFVLNQRNWKLLQHKEEWQVRSNYSHRVAPAAVDQNLLTFWASHVPMTYGMFFQVDIHTPSLLNGIIFHGEDGQDHHPETWIVKTSVDGQVWHTVKPHPPIRYRSMLIIPFSQVKARYVHVVLTADSSYGARWMIHELDLLQPIIPWRLEQTDLLVFLCGYLFILGVMSLCLSAKRRQASGIPWRVSGVFFSFLLIILLPGWILRVYHLDAAELTAQEMQIFSVADLGKDTHTEWLQGYFDYSQTGISWLALLGIRWIYQATENVAFSIRIIPVLLGSFLIVLLPLFQKKLFINPKQSSRDESSWQFLVLSGLAGLSLFPIVTSRIGEFAVITGFFLILYLGISYQVVFRQGTSWWYPLSTLLLLLGFFIEPEIGYGVLALLIASGIALLVQIFTGCLSSSVKTKSLFLRFLLLFLFALPVFCAWYVLNQRTSPETRLFLSPTFFHPTNGDNGILAILFQIFRFYGFPGIAAWICLLLLIMGIVQSIFQKKSGMLFLTIQALAFFLLAALPSQPAPDLGFLMFSLIIACLLADSFTRILGLASRKLRHPLAPPATMILLGYIGFFSANSLFFGSSSFPFLSNVYEDTQRRQAINSLLHIVRTDPDECKTIATMESELTALYPQQYDLELYAPELSELTRLASLGRFRKYLLLSTTQPQEYIEDFLTTYYEEIGRSLSVILYRVRDEFYSGRPERFTWRDLRFTTGKAVEDQTSSTEGARYAEQGEQRGFLSSGPTIRMCQPGWYIARFVLRSQGDAEDIVAILDIKANRYQSLARRTLRAGEFQNSTTYQTFDVPFFLDMAENQAFQMARVQLRVYFTGAADLWLDYIDLLPQRI